MARNGKKAEPLPIILLVLFVIAYIISAIRPLDRLAWIGQMTPAVLLVLLLVVTYRKFRFSTFVYVMAFLHALLLLYGAHYTYSQNPLFNQWKEQFGWERNYFDRVGHFAQGFVPAFLAKEFLLRCGYVEQGKLLMLIVSLACLGFSAAYVLSEFAVVQIMDVPADTVMGTQGDAFDSLWDMIWALIGASLAVFVFGPFHDSQIEQMWDG